MTTKRRSLSIPQTTDRLLQLFLDGVKEIVEVGAGGRGDPKDRYLTLGDLEEAGMISFRDGATGYIDPTLIEPVTPDLTPDLSTPPQPTGFLASGSFGYIFLAWSNPADGYKNHSLTNIYRSTEDNFANAELINRDSGMSYTDQVRQELLDANDPSKGIGYYYWITWVSDTGVEGPPNSAAGTYAESIPDAGVVMDILSERIDESLLSQSLNSRLEGMEQGISDTAEYVEGEFADVRQTLAVNGAAIQETKNVTEGLGAQWSVKLDVNGYVSGVGTYNNGETSDFAIIADRFWITAPNGVGKRKPFILQDGVVRIDTAVIREGSIQSGHIGALSFGKLVDDNGLPITTVAGKLKADHIDVDNLDVAEATRFTGQVSSSGYVPGSAGFMINPSKGSAEFNNVTVRGTLFASDITGDVSKIVPVKRHINTPVAATSNSPSASTLVGTFDIPKPDNEEGHYPYFNIAVHVVSAVGTGIGMTATISAGGHYEEFYTGGYACGNGGCTLPGALGVKVDTSAQVRVYVASSASNTVAKTISGFVGGAV